MKRYSRILIIVNLILLLGYFNWSVYQKEKILENGQLLLLQLAPVDPRSLMQGDYMRLSYEEARSELIQENTPAHGYAILKTDSNQVGQVIRLQENLEPISKNELAIKYKVIDSRLFFGAESFFFEEGQADVYENAVYGGLKVDRKGQSLLIGLYDEKFQLIQPKSNK
ncbi:GDYXXLXY domain-containing protein [Bacteroides sp.]|uniref:GDYXXLXY domain-containing protein n=1 Tax=Bacteroides sp. TaxID=29523 RepID=UPI00261594D0|nr:GDYXXLXY domain-containing protein [Bacteroides sp.]MDD3039874.1 GDYXXLXY domain-containing protein [Bacteroides sp.]